MRWRMCVERVGWVFMFVVAAPRRACVLVMGEVAS